MKTTIITTLLILATTLLMAGPGASNAVSGDKLYLEEENYVNDIPFDTWKVSRAAFPPDLTLEDESYVDDIPFNTAEIAGEAMMNKAVEQKDESSVNDIPFNTGKICNEVLLGRYISQWQDEGNVNDIPFSTCQVMSAAGCCRGITIIYNDPFMIQTNKCMQEKLIKLEGLETLSFGYPF